MVNLPVVYWRMWIWGRLSGYSQTMKNGNDNKIAVSAALRKAGETWRAFSGRGLTKASTVGFKKRVTGLLEEASKEAFVSLSVKDGRVRRFWVSKVVPDDFHDVPKQTFTPG